MTISENIARGITLLSIISIVLFGYSQYNAGFPVAEIPVNFPKENLESTFTKMNSEPFELSSEMNPIKIRLSIINREKFTKNYHLEKKRWKFRNSTRYNIQISPSSFKLIKDGAVLWKVAAIKEIRRGRGGLSSNESKYKTINTFEINESNTEQKYRVEIDLNNWLLQKEVDGIFIEIRRNALNPPQLWGILSFFGLLVGIAFLISKKI